MQSTTNRILSVSLAMFAILGANTAVSANLNVSNAFTLFDQRRYQEARIAFESDIRSTWQDLGAAYAYALTLWKLGRSADAIKVCKRILREYPKSEWAFASQESLKEWTGKSLSQPDTGIIGLKFTVSDGQPAKVERIFPRAPASSQLRQGDIIMAVDGVPTEGQTNEAIIRSMSGSPGARITLTIKRDEETLERTLIRMSLKAFSSSQPDIWRMYLNQREDFSDSVGSLADP